MTAIDTNTPLQGASNVGSATSDDASASHVSDAGLAFLKGSEGLRLDAYLDSGGVPTIGYGSTNGVQLGDRINAEQAMQLLAKDTGWAQEAVRESVDVPLTQGQFDALTSFTYNVGAGAFENSTLLAKLNAGDFSGAQAEFARWDNAGGQELEGLARRRRDEAALFGGDMPVSSASGGDATNVSSMVGPAQSGYSVRAGDTLSEIARGLGVSLDALIAANPQVADPDLIFAGQQINLPTREDVQADEDRGFLEMLSDALLR
jgi:GH24 family phage-related lysozyme (muramidase)